MKFKHILFGIVLSTLFITNSYSLNLNKVYSIKTVSSANLEINGHVEGKISADVVIIGKNAVIKGDIFFKST